jgi:branched-chain amino acid aminotransferase
MFFRLGDHLDRWESSCRALRLTCPYTRDEVIAILLQLVRRTGLRQSYVEVICTRGIPPAGARDIRLFENRFYAFAVPYVWLLRPEDADSGMDAVITTHVERISPVAVDPRVKNFHWGDLTRGLHEAYDRGARYPILLDARGFVTEGPGYNVFALVDGKLLTPASGTLEGITRKTVLELAAGEGLEVAQADLRPADLRVAAELFATSTAGGIMPITTLDADPVGDGRVGPVTELIRTRYWEAHSDPRYTVPVVYEEGIA